MESVFDFATAIIIFLYISRHLFNATYSGIIDEISRYPLYALYQAINLMFVTFFTDYLSVFKTRLFINALSKGAGILATIVIMISDIVISIIIIYSVYVFYLLIIAGKLELLIGNKNITGPHDSSIGIGGLSSGLADLIELIYIMFLTNCVTIGWVLLFSISLLTLRLALAMDPIFRLFRWLLPVDDLPVRSVGIAASCVFGLALASGQLLHFIFLT